MIGLKSAFSTVLATAAAFILASPSVVADDVCMWCDSAMSNNFLDCMCADIANRLIFSSLPGTSLDDMKDSMIAASTAFKKSSDSMKMSMMNGAMAGEMAELIKSQSRTEDPDALTSELMQIVGACYVKASGQPHAQFTLELGKIVDFMLRQFGPGTEAADGQNINKSPWNNNNGPNPVTGIQNAFSGAYSSSFASNQATSGGNNYNQVPNQNYPVQNQYYPNRIQNNPALQPSQSPNNQYNAPPSTQILNPTNGFNSLNQQSSWPLYSTNKDSQPYNAPGTPPSDNLWNAGAPNYPINTQNNQPGIAPGSNNGNTGSPDYPINTQNNQADNAPNSNYWNAGSPDYPINTQNNQHNIAPGNNYWNAEPPDYPINTQNNQPNIAPDYNYWNAGPPDYPINTQNNPANTAPDYNYWNAGPPDYPINTQNNQPNIAPGNNYRNAGSPDYPINTQNNQPNIAPGNNYWNAGPPDYEIGNYKSYDDNSNYPPPVASASNFASSGSPGDNGNGPATVTSSTASTVAKGYPTNTDIKGNGKKNTKENKSTVNEKNQNSQLKGSKTNTIDMPPTQTADSKSGNSDADDDVERAVKFAEMVYLILVKSATFTKIYNEGLRNDDAATITDYIIFNGLIESGYPGFSDEIATATVGEIHSLPEKTSSATYAEAITKSLMVQFHKNKLIGDEPENQATYLATAILAQLKSISPTESSESNSSNIPQKSNKSSTSNQNSSKDGSNNKSPSPDKNKTYRESNNKDNQKSSKTVTPAGDKNTPKTTTTQNDKKTGTPNSMSAPNANADSYAYSNSYSNAPGNKYGTSNEKNAKQNSSKNIGNTDSSKSPTMKKHKKPPKIVTKTNENGDTYAYYYYYDDYNYPDFENPNYYNSNQGKQGSGNKNSPSDDKSQSMDKPNNSSPLPQSQFYQTLYSDLMSATYFGFIFNRQTTKPDAIMWSSNLLSNLNKDYEQKIIIETSNECARRISLIPDNSDTEIYAQIMAQSISDVFAFYGLISYDKPAAQADDVATKLGGFQKEPNYQQIPKPIDQNKNSITPKPERKNRKQNIPQNAGDKDSSKVIPQDDKKTVAAGSISKSNANAYNFDNPNTSNNKNDASKPNKRKNRRKNIQKSTGDKNSSKTMVTISPSTTDAYYPNAPDNKDTPKSDKTAPKQNTPNNDSTIKSKNSNNQPQIQRTTAIPNKNSPKKPKSQRNNRNDNSQQIPSNNWNNNAQQIQSNNQKKNVQQIPSNKNDNAQQTPSNNWNNNAPNSNLDGYYNYYGVKNRNNKTPKQNTPQTAENKDFSKNDNKSSKPQTSDSQSGSSGYDDAYYYPYYDYYFDDENNNNGGQLNRKNPRQNAPVGDNKSPGQSSSSNIKPKSGIKQVPKSPIDGKFSKNDKSTVNNNSQSPESTECPDSSTEIATGQKNKDNFPINKMGRTDSAPQGREVSQSSDLTSTSQPPQTIFTEKSDETKERIKILMKWAIASIKDGKFDYKLFSSVISALAKYMKQVHPETKSEKALFKVLIDAIIALTQLLIKAPPEYYKDGGDNVGTQSKQQDNAKISGQNTDVPNAQSYSDLQQDSYNSGYQAQQGNINMPPPAQNNYAFQQPADNYQGPEQGVNTQSYSYAQQSPSNNQNNGAQQIPFNNWNNNAQQIPSNNWNNNAQQIPSNNRNNNAQQIPSNSQNNGDQQIPSNNWNNNAQQIPSNNWNNNAQQIPLSNQDNGAQQISSNNWNVDGYKNSFVSIQNNNGFQQGQEDGSNVQSYVVPLAGQNINSNQNWQSPSQGNYNNQNLAQAGSQANAGSTSNSQQSSEFSQGNQNGWPSNVQF